MPKSKVAIAGAGMAGAYLYRLLSMQGMSAELFDMDTRTACGISPCAWGTSPDFYDLVSACGLDPEGYILQKPNHVRIDDLPLKIELITFDKPRLIRDLLHGARIRKEPLDIGCYDRVIDATGGARVFLPPVRSDLLLPCIQYRVKSDQALENRIRLGGVGYAWCFPLSEGEYHIGCGSLRKNPKTLLESLGWLDLERMQIQCACAAKIRLTGPATAAPFVTAGAAEGVWGVGEAIGCVGPLAGDGVVPGMGTARLLLRHWNDPVAYTRAIMKEYAWMEKERRVLYRLISGNSLGLREAWVLKKNASRIGMNVPIRNAAVLIRHLR